ncbi:hypothetical protein P152DRAFT_469221 [Eremomyces bilateralis CBS 781.70]|uniref:MFS general substrate transporter n=1 Tax=Eremomyces bilateralis CBS 781.70 TaxID=1392243 RepID=A0A6G1FQF2_9PEZI|nr:uncharacterized protein P152DRAFT_469221 [Eremomyces bilateralis CBS 781.70]KAF1808024.1 hypothetical protein P152DRAFT_469221 [Eremomyces bilateralis CBS 781.70]
MFPVNVIWSPPDINPINSRARGIPVFNPIDRYGRYAFPPLLTRTIRQDLNLSQAEVANSNIVALTATMIVRVTRFFNLNVVGTANTLTGGLGNSGGGITYFAMPAIFDSLVHHRGLTPHIAWRVAFIVPFIFITTIAVGMLLLCDDTPTGKWSDRMKKLDENHNKSRQDGLIPKKEKDVSELEMAVEGETEVISEYHHEAIRSPTLKETLEVFLSPQTQLAINSYLGSYYLTNVSPLGQPGSGRWAAMFGLLNVAFRPAGGVVADLLYKYTDGNLWAKKMWVHLGCVGFTGAWGNLGGIVFAVIFRYHGTDYAKTHWIIDIVIIGINLAGCWICPVSIDQIGAR